MGSWIYTAAAASLLCAVCLSLVPEGSAGKALKFVCGIVMTAAVLTPLVGIDLGEYSISAAKYKLEAEKILSTAEESRDELNRMYIEAEYSAYILDKAKNNGIVPDEVNVVLNWCSEGYWYPHEVQLVLGTKAKEDDIAALEAIIEAELGVPRERQTWKTE